MAQIRLNKGETRTLTIQAADLFSPDSILTEPNEKYTIEALPNQTWMDWTVSSSPDGYFNLFDEILGQRVKGVKYLCLCGAYNSDIKTGFGIGKGPANIVALGGALSFFANDSPTAYWNNHGSIKINVTRNS